MTMHVGIVDTLDVSTEAQGWEDRHMLECADRTLSAAIEMLEKFRDAVRSAGGDIHKLCLPTLPDYHLMGEASATIGSLGAIRTLRIQPETPIVIQADQSLVATGTTKIKKGRRRR